MFAIRLFSEWSQNVSLVNDRNMSLSSMIFTKEYSLAKDAICLFLVNDWILFLVNDRNMSLWRMMFTKKILFGKRYNMSLFGEWCNMPLFLVIDYDRECNMSLLGEWSNTQELARSRVRVCACELLCIQQRLLWSLFTYDVGVFCAWNGSRGVFDTGVDKYGSGSIYKRSKRYLSHI